MTQNSCLGYVPSGYNYIINPSFEVNQRGVASQTVGGTFPVDMWRSYYTGSGASLTSSQQAFTLGQTLVPGEPKNYLRAESVGGSAVNSFVFLLQYIEGVRTLAGQSAVLTFYAKTTTSAKPISIEFAQNFGTGGSASAQVNAIGVTKLTISTSWTKYTVPVTLPSMSDKTLETSANALTVLFWLSGGSNFNSRTNSLGTQSGTFEFANVKLEAGSVATPFVMPRFADELRKCQRYLVVKGGNVVYEDIGVFSPATSTTSCEVQIVLPVPMRAVPSIIAPTAYANFRLSDASAGVALSENPSVTSVSSSNLILLLVCTVASGLTQYRPYKLTAQNQTTDRFILSAEL